MSRLATLVAKWHSPCDAESYNLFRRGKVALGEAVRAFHPKRFLCFTLRRFGKARKNHRRLRHNGCFLIYHEERYASPDSSHKLIPP